MPFGLIGLCLIATAILIFFAADSLVIKILGWIGVLIPGLNILVVIIFNVVGSSKLKRQGYQAGLFRTRLIEKS